MRYTEPGKAYNSIEELTEAGEVWGWAKAKPGEHAYDELDARWYISIIDKKGNHLIERIVKDAHLVTEHEDGTITVYPSLAFENGWHGWLEKGEFEWYSWEPTSYSNYKNDNEPSVPRRKGNRWSFTCMDCEDEEAEENSLYCKSCNRRRAEEDEDIIGRTNVIDYAELCRYCTNKHLPGSRYCAECMPTDERTTYRSTRPGKTPPDPNSKRSQKKLAKKRARDSMREAIRAERERTSQRDQQEFNLY